MLYGAFTLADVPPRGTVSTCSPLGMARRVNLHIADGPVYVPPPSIPPPPNHAAPTAVRRGNSDGRGHRRGATPQHTGKRRGDPRPEERQGK